ncbi:uncharacterized protein BX663DRAFT_438647 [Cokeromyces recurvatus]|uniref:uncharacterized protein n=1 Tax=Cokeromyces recurvatus TaxID=90255 RepID=UPI0022202C4C|nr:uncharacterized protein BX663DRAFT_438647 [Cokeromyces recurvatus]KAI7900752.1 hypothetical protein BX663DRAFT_438647 [Cokeromyces recurvatus]
MSSSPLFRHYATTTARAQTPAQVIRIPSLPVILISTGLVCLGLGLYEYYTSDIQKFPAAVRQALRKGLYYEQHSKDDKLALKYFKEALQLALASPELERNGAPLTGIMIQLGSLQERMGQLSEARQTLIMALRHLVGTVDQPLSITQPQAFFSRLSSLEPLEQKKVIGIAQKLGDIALAMQRDEEAELWYVGSVEHLLKIASTTGTSYEEVEDDNDDRSSKNNGMFDKEHMPDWLTSTDVGAALEALGGFYASRNKPILAIHLYLKALSLNDIKSCQSVVLMNNLAESYSNMGQYEEAKMWAQKGLDLAQNPNTGKVNKDKELCDETCGILLFNMGMLFEVR